MNRLTFTSILCGTVLTAILTGCGGPAAPEQVTEATATVKGKVTQKDRPLTSGNIVLYSLTNGNSVEAALDKKGEFSFLDPIPAVEYTVFFRAADGGTHTQVPKDFQSETSSSYKVTVTPGENDLSIEIGK